ncbi:MAG: methyltransferase domain-containing protein [Methylococcales bacterium]|nr:methyltransferase domain-containing protein [Methylococcales bacterium]
MRADRNFDNLAQRFQARIYDGFKGQWRLHLLKQDLAEIAQGSPETVLDVGCGAGYMALWLAEHGHQLTLSDISKRQLKAARSVFKDAGQTADFMQMPVQAWPGRMAGFKLVMVHALLEWLAEPETVLTELLAGLKPGAWLSLLFYNRNAMVFCNALRGGWRLKPLLTDRYLGVGHRLTPPNPLFPHCVEQLLIDQGLVVHRYTGIRVFHDYLSAKVRAETDCDELQSLEQHYCRQPDFRGMGRYVHLLAQKPVVFASV